MTIKEAINDPKDFIDIHLTCYGEKDTVAVSLDNVDVEAFHMAIKALQETRWIPVSEKLPEKNVEVLATTEWGSVTIAERYSANDYFINDGATNADEDEIIAWMPLPEPYKAESEDKE